MNSNEIIRVQNLTYRYRDGVLAKNKENVINNASFSINKGFVYGMAGKNGAGKTTLLRLLSGEITKYQGSIDMAGVSDLNQYKNNIGVISESTAYLPHLSVIENATILGGLYKNFDMERFKEYIRLYEIDEYAILSSLSSGEKIKFCIAFSMAYEPQVLIMDEPAGVLDITSREELVSQIRLLVTEKNKTVIVATHLTNDLDNLADYIMFVSDDGEVSVCDRESMNDRYVLLKGSSTQMSKIPSDKLLAIEETETSVTAMTDRFNDIRKVAEKNDVIIETPNIEAIMYFKDMAEKKREKTVKKEKYSPENRCYEGSNYDVYLESYGKMIWCSNIKWGQRITGFLLFLWCSFIIATETDWENILQQLIFLSLLFAQLCMFIDSFEAPKNMNYKKLFAAFATRPVSKKDVYRKILVQRAKGIALAVISQVAVIMLYSGERMDENIEGIICVYIGAGIIAAVHMAVELWKMS